jgi:hypothetical protein
MLDNNVIGIDFMIYDRVYEFISLRVDDERKIIQLHCL